MKLLKKTLLFLVFVLAGVAISFVFDGELRKLIQDFYVFFTDNKISFYGKNFHLFSKRYYYVSFALWASVLWLIGQGKNAKILLSNGIMVICFFLICLGLLSAVDSHFKLIECTMCDDGTKSIHIINGINYELLITISLVVSVLPSILIGWYCKNK